MGHYKSNLRDLEFNLFEVFGAADRMGSGPYHEMDPDTAREVLREVPGMCGAVLGGITPGLWGYEAGQSGVGDIFGWFIRNGVPPLQRPFRGPAPPRQPPTCRWRRSSRPVGATRSPSRSHSRSSSAASKSGQNLSEK